MIVAAGPDGILVSDKEKSSFIKEYVDHIDMRPMYEEREWGDYTVLNVNMDEEHRKAVPKKKTVQRGGGGRSRGECLPGVDTEHNRAGLQDIEEICPAADNDLLSGVRNGLSQLSEQLSHTLVLGG